MTTSQSFVIASAITGALINGLTERSIITGAINGAINGLMVAGVGKISDTIFGTEIMSPNVCCNFNTNFNISKPFNIGFKTFSGGSSGSRSISTSSF